MAAHVRATTTPRTPRARAGPVAGHPGVNGPCRLGLPLGGWEFFPATGGSFPLIPRRAERSRL